jgi:hypothetical protein
MNFSHSSPTKDDKFMHFQANFNPTTLIFPFQVSFNLIELGAPPLNFLINSAELQES